MERIGATSSSDAMRMPISQIQAVSRRAHVGSPLALPWPKTCVNRKKTHSPYYINVYNGIKHINIPINKGADPQ